jgi:hypothetical protein
MSDHIGHQFNYITEIPLQKMHVTHSRSTHHINMIRRPHGGSRKEDESTNSSHLEDIDG